MKVRHLPAAGRSAVEAKPTRSRGLIDALVCLGVAVILFRSFELEGYIISTGSMAPSLLGFHKRVVCPSCGYSFAFGIAAGLPRGRAIAGDARPGTASSGAAADDEGVRSGPVRCPNCTYDVTNVDSVPANYGDQLLVQKQVYEFRDPRRWEVVVLQNVTRPSPPYVKRVVGLPRESVQLIDGDVYIDGAICRKSLEQQMAMRLPVYDADYPPADLPSESECWTAERSGTLWRKEGHGFRVAPPAAAAGPASTPEVSWLDFRRWRRRGGSYRTEVEVGAGADVRLPRMPFFPVEHDVDHGHLVCVGALDSSLRGRLLAMNPVPSVRAAIDRLAERSHLGPVTDDYGYNRADAGLRSFPERDVMLECAARIGDGDGGEWIVEIARGRDAFQVVFDRSHHQVRLLRSGDRAVLRTADLPREAFGAPMNVAVSAFDRRVIAALDGSLLFEPWECGSDAGDVPRTPIRIGARGLAVDLSRLQVFRDVYYTRGQGRNAVDQPFRLGADEYFVLGDNSPVSNDARGWPEGGVKRSQLIGKPIVVHLPSRQIAFPFAGRQRYIRIPDFSRMRYIR